MCIFQNLIKFFFGIYWNLTFKKYLICTKLNCQLFQNYKEFLLPNAYYVVCTFFILLSPKSLLLFPILSQKFIRLECVYLSLILFYTLRENEKKNERGTETKEKRALTKFNIISILWIDYRHLPNEIHCSFIFKLIKGILFKLFFSDKKKKNNFKCFSSSSSIESI